MQNPPKVVLITPAYNEQETIHIIVKSALELVAKGVISDFAVIDDCSADITARIARDLGANVISLPENKGKGGAFLEGALYAKRNGADILITIDADLIKPLEARIVSRMIDEVSNGGISMAVFPVNEGGRYVECNLSGQRAIRMPCLEFLFEGKGMGAKFSASRPAKRFMKTCTGYGLEIALDHQLKNRKKIRDRDACMDFMEAHRDNTKEMQKSDIDRTTMRIAIRQMGFGLVRRLRTSGWHRQGFAKRMASRAVLNLVRFVN